MLYERELVANLGFCRISDRFRLVEISQIIMYMMIVKFYHNQYIVQVRPIDYIECLENHCKFFASTGRIHELVSFLVASIVLNLQIYSTMHQDCFDLLVICYRMFDHHDDKSIWKKILFLWTSFWLMRTYNLQEFQVSCYLWAA